MLRYKERYKYPIFVLFGIVVFIIGCLGLSHISDKRAQENLYERTIDPSLVPRITETEMDIMIGGDLHVTKSVIVHEGVSYLITEEEYLFLEDDGDPTEMLRQRMEEVEQKGKNHE